MVLANTVAGRISVGVVINPTHLEKYGDTIERQYEAYLNEEPSLKFYTQGRKTPDARGQISELSTDIRKDVRSRLGNGGGRGWVYRPGVFHGIVSEHEGAFEIMKAIEVAAPNAMKKYENGRHWELRMWQRVIDSWYTGRLFNLYRAGQKHKNGLIGRRISGRVQKRLLRIFTGQAVDDIYAMQLFEYLVPFGQLLRDPRDLVVA